MTTERRAPVQGDYWLPKGSKGRIPGTIAWAEHLLAWDGYAAEGHGDQDAERIATRGGFGWGELLRYLGREPQTWEAR